MRVCEGVSVVMCMRMCVCEDVVRVYCVRVRV